MFLAFWLIIYVEKAFRKVPVQYAKRVVNNRVFGGQASHLPIKINISGVMPPIFASALLQFPLTIGSFVSDDSALKPYLDSILAALNPGNFFYNFVLVLMVIFFAYFYTSIQFKTDDIVESLRKNGGFILGIRPGAKTQEFLNYIVARLTLVGGIYIAVICVLPRFF